MADDATKPKGFFRSTTGIIVTIAGLVAAVAGAVTAVKACCFPPEPVALSLSEVSLPFNGITVGTSSAKDLEITYHGGKPRAVTVSLGGGDRAEFQIANECSTGPMTDGSTCVVSVYFIPTNVGHRSAKLVVTSSDGPSAEAGLEGDGLPFGVIAFDPPTGPLIQLPEATGNATAASGKQDLTLLNTGAGPITIGTVTLGDPGFTVTANCNGHIIGPGSGCIVKVTFSTTAKTALVHGTLRVTHNAPGSPQSVPVGGSRGKTLQWNFPKLPGAILPSIRISQAG